MSGTIGTARRQRIARNYYDILTSTIRDEMEGAVKRIMAATDRIARQEGMSDKDQIALRMLALDKIINLAAKETLEACDNINPHKI